MTDSTNSALYVRFAKWSANFFGNSKVFVLAIVIILGWIITGPIFHYSDTWQLVINTFTSIVTFLMVFMIQNSQNRDTQAIQAKLNELIRATEGAHNSLLDLEESVDGELEECHAQFQELAQLAKAEINQGADDTGTPNRPLLSTNDSASDNDPIQSK